MPRRFRLSRRTLAPALVGLLLAAGFGLYLFQPWKAFTSTTVDEALPSASAPSMRESGTSTARPAAPRDLAEGRFVTHEHTTSGTARTVRLADGGQVLRLEDLKTSEGPDVRVYLSPRDAGAVTTGLGAGAVELGKLKGNLGNQNYAVPNGTDLSKFRSAVIWCARFSVPFGAANLAPAAG
ncbi:DM13 domain-containing protein [Streptomyces sp. NPDC048506]|uniref:DM13 domain-containing protein n=1 Tax=Streptomyces sp. NPDC048506 TaxID=3155028 RepID=UPI00342E0395